MCTVLVHANGFARSDLYTELGLCQLSLCYVFVHASLTDIVWQPVSIKYFELPLNRSCNFGCLVGLLFSSYGYHLHHFMRVFGLLIPNLFIYTSDLGLRTFHVGSIE